MMFDIENSVDCSIVICSYNRKELLRQAIESVLNQETEYSYQIIVGDDNSSDGSRELLLEYQKNYGDIFVLNFQKSNIGLGSNWASSMKLASGKYVALLDDDDFWHNNNKLQLQITFMEKHPDVGLTYTDYRILDGTNGKLSEKHVHNDDEGDLLNSLFKGKYAITVCTSLLRKSIVDKYVQLDDYLSYGFPIQDWCTWMLLAKHTKFQHLPISTATYRRYHVGAMTNMDSYEELLEKYTKERRMYIYLCEHLDLTFDSSGWDSYVNSLLLSLAYKKQDYISAHKYGSQIGANNIKRYCSRYRCLFVSYCLIKKFKIKVCSLF